MKQLFDAEELEELRKREKEKGITPDWELDAFMKAETRKGKKESIITDLVIKMLGLDVSLCRHSGECWHKSANSLLVYFVQSVSFVH